MKDFTLPKLCKSKSGWYVYFRYRFYNTVKEKWDWKQYKHRQGLSVQNLKDRERTAKVLMGELLNLLKEGYNPIVGVHGEETEIVALKQTELMKLLRDMLDLKKGTLRHRSYQAYKYSLDILGKYLSENHLQFIKPNQFTEQQALLFSDWVLREKKYKGKSFNGLISFLRIMFNSLVDRDAIERNPFKKVRKMQEETGKNLAFDEKQKSKIKEHLQKHDPRMWLFVKFVYHCYIRPLELLRVRVQDVDTLNRVIIIHAQIGKNKRQMSVTIPDTFIDEVKAMNLETFDKDAYLFSNTKIGNNANALTVGKKPCSRNSISERHSKALRALGFPRDYTLYSWKHTGVCDACRAGLNIYDIMRQLRHHSLEQTLTYMKSLGLQPNTGFQTKAPAL